MIIERFTLDQLKNLSQSFPAIGVIGPRQVGKTTMVKAFRNIIDKETVYLDLELISDLDKLKEPELFLSRLADKCVIIDEIQHKPDLFPLIRSLIDQQREPCRFIILGSASPVLLRQSSESLAGRIAYIELHPFAFPEIQNLIPREQHHFYGGFPDALLADSAEAGKLWLNNFIRTYTEKDLPMYGLSANPLLIRRLWEMLAWINGNLLNLNMLGKSLGINYHTIDKYITYLENTFLVRKLEPFHYNMKKRLVKTPKIYICDSGVLHRLLRIDSVEQLMGHAILGYSWESYVIEQISALKRPDIDLYFYRTHNGAEVDLLFTRGPEPVATAEIKFTSSPHPEKGFYYCIDDLQTTKNFIITPDSDDYPVKENIQVCSMEIFLDKYFKDI
ncbi:MAG: ATP-binding protein [Bacteroidales bacterium]|nr:ATP-binding protein [Bacteroidales bacterium]